MIAAGAGDRGLGRRVLRAVRRRCSSVAASDSRARDRTRRSSPAGAASSAGRSCDGLDRARDARSARSRVRRTRRRRSRPAGALPVRGDLFDDDVLVRRHARVRHGLPRGGRQRDVPARPGRHVPHERRRLRIGGRAPPPRRGRARAWCSRRPPRRSARPRGVVGTRGDAAPRHVPLARTSDPSSWRSSVCSELGADAGRGRRLREPVLRPGAGPDRRLRPVAHRARERAGCPVVVETFLSIVDVDDCTNGHLARRDPRPSRDERYLLNGASLTTSACRRARAGGRGTAAPRGARPRARWRRRRARWRIWSAAADAPRPAVLLRARADAAARPPLRRLPGRRESSGCVYHADRGDRRSDARLVRASAD